MREYPLKELKHPTPQAVIGRNLRARRNELELSQKFVAEQVDFPLNALKHIEYGRRSVPLEILPKLQEVLRIDDHRRLFQPDAFL